MITSRIPMFIAIAIIGSSLIQSTINAQDGDSETSALRIFQSWSSLSTSDRATLVNRLCNVLIKSQPSRASVQQVVNDESFESYQKLVDELLESTPYAERSAECWLDKARNVIALEESLRFQSVPEYVAWCKQSFQQDLPYVQFIRMQLAGDLLSPDRKEIDLNQWSRTNQIPTTFQRLARPSFRSNKTEEEWHRVLDKARANCIATLILAVKTDSVDCELIRYFFGDMDESILAMEDGDEVASPRISRANHSTLNRYREAAKSMLQDYRNLLDGMLQAQEIEDWYGRLSEWPLPEEDLMAEFKIEMGATNKKMDTSVNSPPIRIEKQNNRISVRLDDTNALQFESGIAFNRFDAFSIQMELYVPSQTPSGLIGYCSQQDTLSHPCGFEFGIRDGRLHIEWVDQWPRETLTIETHVKLPTDKWANVVIVNQANGLDDDLQVYVDGTRCSVAIIDRGITRSFKESRKPFVFCLGKRHDQDVCVGAQVANVSVYKIAMTEIEALGISGDPEMLDWSECTIEQRRAWVNHFLTRILPQGKYLIESLQHYQSSADDLLATAGDIPVAANPLRARSVPANAHLDQDSLRFFSGMDVKEIRDRVQFVEWIIRHRTERLADVACHDAFDRMELGANTVDEKTFAASKVLLQESGWRLKELVRRIAVSQIFCENN